MKSFVKQLGGKATTRDCKMILFSKIKEHMVKRLLWKTSKDSEPAIRKGYRRQKRKSQEVEADGYEKSKSSLRLSKRLRRCTDSKENHDQRSRSNRNHSTRKRRSNVNNVPLVFVSEKPHTVICKGLKNLGNSCYFNSVVQCLYHCPIFRGAIELVAPEALTVVVVNQLQMLFRDMAGFGSLPYITPIKCLTAAMNIKEC